MTDIYVFGSNLQGVHGRGAAKKARESYGAVYGKGEGLEGQSYALPTKRTPYKVLALSTIHYHINQFITHAQEHTQNKYYITRIGCGLAGYNWEEDILPLFPNPLPRNCVFTKAHALP